MIKHTIYLVCLFTLYLIPLKIQANQFKTDKLRKQIIIEAKKLIGNNSKYIKIKDKTFRGDCSGFILAIYYGAGINLKAKINQFSNEKSIVKRLYLLYKNKIIKSDHKVKTADIILFNNTFDRNKNKKWDDKLTHIGVVEKIDSDGTITWIHRNSKGIIRQKMNLRQPKTYINNQKKVINDFLRRKNSYEKKPSGHYLAGYLFHGFFSVL